MKTITRIIVRARPALRISAAATAALLAAAPAAGQSLWTGLERPQGILLELHHPELAGRAFGALSGVGFAGARLATSERLAFVADLPFAYADREGASDFAVGSPYLGIETRRDGGAFFEAGVRLPTASAEAGAFVGAATEIVDRPGAFSSEAFVVSAAGTWGGVSTTGVLHRVRVGPRFLIPEDGGDVEVLIDYGGVIGFETARWGVEGGLNGWAVVTEDVDGLGEATVHQAGVQAYRRWSGGRRLGLLFRVPLDEDASDLTDFSVGLVATLPF